MKSKSLLKLFNVGLFDFAKENKDGSYTGVEWPTYATHRLHPTSWNHRKLYRPNGHGKIQMPLGFALSVCAEPLKRKYRLRGKVVKLRRKLPPGGPIYLKDGPLDGKRRVILHMVQCTGAKIPKRTIGKATSQQLDTIYRNIISASRHK